jgi:hypothetical protein
MNMRRPTLRGTIEYTKKTLGKDLMPKDIPDMGVQGLNMYADFYYGAAHIRQLIDRIAGRGATQISVDQVEAVFKGYNGSGPIAAKYGTDAINLLKDAAQGKSTLYFYEK